MSKTILQGLVGAWCPSLGPSGYTLLDRSVRSNHGTLTNMDAGSDWVMRNGRPALDLDGSDDYVDAGTKTLPITSAVTLSMWANFSAMTASTFYTFFSFGGYIANGFVFQRSGDLNILRFAWNGDNFFNGPAFSTANSLTHLCVTAVGQSIIFYVDSVATTGARGNGVANFAASGAQAINIGRRADSATQYIAGAVFEVAVWPLVLTSTQVRQLFVLGAGGLGRLLTPQRRSYAFRVPAAGNRRRRIICGAEC
jgi:hypothetical protein